MKRRHLAPAVYAEHDDELSFSASGPRDDKGDLEMKDISLPLRITGIDAGLSEATLRKRPHKGELDASTRLGAVSITYYSFKQKIYLFFRSLSRPLL